MSGTSKTQYYCVKYWLSSKETAFGQFPICFMGILDLVVLPSSWNVPDNEIAFAATWVQPVDMTPYALSVKLLSALVSNRNYSKDCA